MTYSLASLPGLLPATKVTHLAPREVLLEAVSQARSVLMPEVPYEDAQALSALEGLVQALYPNHIAQMRSYCPEILRRMDQVSNDSVTFEQAFSGHGPLAQRLGQVAFYERTLPPKDARLTQALTLFDYGPRKATGVQPLQNQLVAELQRRVSPDAQRWIPQRYLRPEHHAMLHSGFYGIIQPSYGVTYLCHLWAMLPNGVEVIANTGGERGFSLYARHPEEGQWFQSDLSSFLPGSIEALWGEYERCSALLNFLPRERAMTYAGVLRRAWQVLSESQRLPEDWYGFARTDGAQRELGVSSRGTHLYIALRGERDPERLSRVFRTYNRAESGYLFSIPFTELNAEEQTMLLTQAHRDMDDIESYLLALPSEIA